MQASASVLYLYGLITEEENEQKAAKSVTQHLKRYIGLLGIQVDFLNETLPGVKSLAIVETANRLKDKIRKFKEILESVKLPQ